MKMVSVAFGVTCCWLGGGQVLAGPHDSTHSPGPAALVSFATSNNALSRIGLTGGPPMIRRVDAAAGGLDLINRLPLLTPTHLEADMVLVRRGSSLWIEPRS
jgi:hypothetical protein